MSNIMTALSVLSLKVLAKYPTKCISEAQLRSGFKMLPEDQHDEVVQNIITYVTNAGRMDDSALPLLAFRENRTYLDLKNTKLTSDYFKKVIDRCGAHLERIDVTGCFQVDDALVKYMLESCPNMQVLVIRNCRKLTDLALEHVVQYGQNIRDLHVGGNFNMTTAGVERFVDKNPALKKFTGLHLSGLRLTSEILAKVGHKCGSLRALSLSYSDVPEAHLRALLEKVGKKLESLTVAWMLALNPEVQCGPDFVEFIGRVCPMLTDLDISGLRGVATTCIEDLVSTKRSLAEEDRMQVTRSVQAFKTIRAKFLGTESFVESMQSTFPELVYEGP